MEKSKYLFDFFPFIFVSNINKQKNKNIINKKLIELYRTNFFDEYTNENLIKDKNKYLTEKNKNEKKYNKNLKVIEYLEKNINIMKKTNFDYIKEMTYGKIFNEYFLDSAEEFVVILDELFTSYWFADNFNVGEAIPLLFLLLLSNIFSFSSILILLMLCVTNNFFIFFNY